jgi:hypothetical protein
MSTDVEVWTCEPIDVEALLPERGRWHRSEHGDERLGRFSCWQFVDEEWLVSVCSPEAIDPDDPEFDVPERVKELLPCVRYRIGVQLEPINPPRPGWDFLNKVIATLATKGPGLGFDVFTGQPIRLPAAEPGS